MSNDPEKHNGNKFGWPVYLDNATHDLSQFQAPTTVLLCFKLHEQETHLVVKTIDLKRRINSAISGKPQQLTSEKVLYIQDAEEKCGKRNTTNDVENCPLMLLYYQAIWI